MKYSKLSDVYQIHKGETIYLIGNGPALLEIPEKKYNEIKNGITIGSNSSHLFMPTSYQSCSSWSSYLLSCHYGEVSGCRFYSGQGIGDDSSWPFGTATTLKSTFFKNNNTIFTSNHAVHPVHRPVCDALFGDPMEDEQIFGADNIIFACTNLATIMGASKIVYVGFDQRESGHYYDKPQLMCELQKQTQEMLEKYSNDPYIVAELQNMIRLNILKDESLKPEFLKKDWCKPKLLLMFECMRKNNVTPFVHRTNSIVYDAGATLKGYDDE